MLVISLLHILVTTPYDCLVCATVQECFAVLGGSASGHARGDVSVGSVRNASASGRVSSLGAPTSAHSTSITSIASTSANNLGAPANAFLAGRPGVTGALKIEYSLEDGTFKLLYLLSFVLSFISLFYSIFFYLYFPWFILS